MFENTLVNQEIENLAESKLDNLVTKLFTYTIVFSVLSALLIGGLLLAVASSMMGASDNLASFIFVFPYLILNVIILSAILVTGFKLLRQLRLNWRKSRPPYNSEYYLLESKDGGTHTFSTRGLRIFLHGVGNFILFGILILSFEVIKWGNSNVDLRLSDGIIAFDAIVKNADILLSFLGFNSVVSTYPPWEIFQSIMVFVTIIVGLIFIINVEYAARTGAKIYLYQRRRGSSIKESFTIAIRIGKMNWRAVEGITNHIFYELRYGSLTNKSREILVFGLLFLGSIITPAWFLLAFFTSL